MEINLDDIVTIGQVAKDFIATPLFRNESVTEVKIKVVNPEGYHIGTICLSEVGDWFVADLSEYGTDYSPND